MEQLREYWETLDPGKKRWVVIGGIATIFVLFMVVTGDDGPKPRKEAVEDIQVTNILTDSDPRELGLDALGSQMKRLQDEITRLRNDNKALTNEVERKQETAVKNMAKEYGESVKKIERLEAALAEMANMRGEVRELRADLINQGVALDEKVAGIQGSQGPQQVDLGQPGAASRRYQLDPVKAKSQHAMSVFAGNDSGSLHVVSEALNTNPSNPDERNNTQIRMVSSATSPAPVTGVEEVDIEEEEHSIVLTAGSIITGVLLNGMDAPTGINTKSDPYPTLIRIKQEAVLPNYHRSDVRECFLIGATHGSLSDERAYTRAETISCVLEDGSAIETSLDGYLVGEDGKLGMRGRLVSKQGKLLQRALAAGFMEGVAGAFEGARVPVVANTASQDQQIQSLLSSGSVKAAGLEGAGKALDRLAEFYIKMAEGIYPVIEIDAGRQVQLVVTKGTALKATM
jgi:conjugal transfer pilus assembly protein TraB